MVAASHLIFRLLHPSHALMTASTLAFDMKILLKDSYLSVACGDNVRPQRHSLYVSLAFSQNVESISISDALFLSAPTPILGGVKDRKLGL